MEGLVPIIRDSTNKGMTGEQIQKQLSMGSIATYPQIEPSSSGMQPLYRGDRGSSITGAEIAELLSKNE